MRGKFLKLLLEISDDQVRRIQSATGDAFHDAIAGWLAQAIEAHLQRIEVEGTPDEENNAASLTVLIQHVRELRAGQRAIAAIVDSSVATLATILRGQEASAASSIGG